MFLTKDEIGNKLQKRGLKVTPQRLAVFEAVIKMGNHPTVENIIEYIRKDYPNVATGTVYHILDVLVDNKLINKVKTEDDIMRYDAEMENHHHLYCMESDRIEDYVDEKLDMLITEYFKKKKIKNFEIEDIKLQINGKFKNKNK